MSVFLSQFSSFNKSAYFQLQCHHIQSDIYHLLVVVFEILPTEFERDFFFFSVHNYLPWQNCLIVLTEILLNVYLDVTTKDT